MIDLLLILSSILAAEVLTTWQAFRENLLWEYLRYAMPNRIYAFAILLLLNFVMLFIVSVSLRVIVRLLVTILT